MICNTRHALEGGLSDDANDKYKNVLESHGWCQTDIDLFLGQLKDNTIELVMRRMRRFRAGARMSSVAAQLPDDENQIPDYMMTMIDNIANTLGKGRNRVIKSLYRIKANQTIGGERLSLLNRLASKYNKSPTSISNDDLDKLVKLLKDGSDRKNALDMIKGAALGQRRLPLLQQLASMYNKNPSSITNDKLDELIELLKDGSDRTSALEMIKGVAMVQDEGGERLALLQQLASMYNKNPSSITNDKLDELIELLKDGSDRTSALEMIKGVALVQDEGGERLALLQQLASEYNHAGGGAKGRRAIEGSNLKRLVTLMTRHGDKDMVVKKIEKLAQKCDVTFWNNYKQLVAYKKKHGMVTVGKDKVLYVHRALAKNNEYTNLYEWLTSMVNYSGVEGDRLNQNKYGVVAHERVGSIEYNALVDLGVVFNNDSLMSAAHKKIEDDRRKDSGNTSNIEGGFTGVRASLFGKKSN